MCNIKDHYVNTFLAEWNETRAIFNFSRMLRPVNRDGHCKETVKIVGVKFQKK